MKTNLLLLAFFSLLLFSCDEDNDDNNNDELLFTSTNYIYEGDLRLFYLESENVRLNDSIAVWSQIPDSDPGYNDAQSSIVESNAEIIENQADSTYLATNFSLDALEVGFVIPDFGPFPPPQPCFCFNVFNELQRAVFLPNTNSLSFNIVVDNETLLETNSNTPLSTLVINEQNSLQYQNFAFDSNYVGEATLNVQTNIHNYSINIYLYNP